MAYSVKSKRSGKTYFLHRRQPTLRGGHTQTIYFFAAQPKDGVLSEIPSGYKLAETITGLPVLKKA